MWKNVEVAYQKKLPLLVTIGSIAVVAAFWFLIPKPVGYYHLLDIVSSSMIIGLAVVLSFSISVCTEVRESLVDFREESKKSAIVLNEIACLSDIGKVREIDEDSVLVAKAFSTAGGSPSQRILLVVADGMGGHSKGEVASALGVTTLANDIIPQLFSDSKDLDSANILTSAINDANSQILNYASNHPECDGMGTTMTATLLSQNKVHIGHVGDTRAYLISEKEINQITKDHSYVQELVDRDEITKEAAKHHPQKNVITRVVGVYGSVQSDIYERPRSKDERILMCCDGLINHVDDPEIKQIVESSLTTKQACSDLIKLANERGGKDNISVIVSPPFARIFKD
jgi:PPM family protein phosphatase